jgi:hypothetical protein
MIFIAAVLFILGIWTNDERWAGTGAVTLLVGLSPWFSAVVRRR